MKKSAPIILIDDNEIDNFINQKTFEGCGKNDILIFTNPTDALEHLEHTKDIPELIMLDIHFPIMDGFEFLDKFRALKISQQSIDIFILTNSLDPADREKANERKCAAFIEKPLTAEAIRKLLRVVS